MSDSMIRMARRRRVTTSAVAAVCAALLLAPAAPAQFKTTRTTRTTSTQDFTLSGIQAWNAAKTNGFTFRPMTFASGQSVSRPYDGVNTRLYRQYRDMFGRVQTVNMAAIVGGNPNVSDSRATVTFELFAGQTLAPGWSIQSVQPAGSYVWDRRVQAGSQDPSFRIKVTGSNSVTIRSVTLRGPSGANWQDAFVGRKSYTVNGIDAWNVARRYGFEFYPIRSSYRYRQDITDIPRDVYSTGALDGVKSMVGRVVNPLVTRGCSPIPAEPRSSCLIAEVVGGNLVVYKAHLGAYARLDFDLFGGGKTLAPGWTVRSVSVSNGTFVTRPADGSSDPRTVVRLASTDTRAASAHITSIVLEGPSNATGWEQAFSGAR